MMIVGVLLTLLTGSAWQSSLSNEEFKAAVSFWSADIGPCELAFRKYCQTARFASMTPIGPEPFPFGSVTKTFTAILVLKMVELGKLNLGNNLSKFKLGIPGDDSISVDQLLTHTSGLPEYFNSVDPASPSSPGEVNSMIRKAASKSRLPRGTFSYANTNYYLLGEVCERVGKASLSELFQRYICRPIGIQCHPEKLATFDLNWYGGAGSMAGSVEDLAAFGAAVATRDPRLLSLKSWSRLTSPHVAMAKAGGGRYGYGVIVADISIYPTLSHGGEIPANRGVAPFVSMFLARDSQTPMSFACLQRKTLDSKSLNALYGAFAATCATADLKSWTATFCSGVSPSRVLGFVRSGAMSADLGKLLTPSAIGVLRGRIGSLKSFTVRGEQVQGRSIVLEGTAKGTVGQAAITGQFGHGGVLESFGIR